MNQRQDLKIFAGQGGMALAKSICHHLDGKLSNAVVGRWLNGEIRVQLLDNVRGKDVFIVQSATSPVNENIMEILLMADAARRASASRITAVLPYFPYSKQEKKMQGREPISAKVMLDMMVCVGVDRLMTVDLHSAAIQGFANIPIDHLPSRPILAKYLRKEKLVSAKTVIVAPDAGAAERGLDLAFDLRCDFAIAFKRHPPDNREAVVNVDLAGDIQGKTAIIVDDMILSGGTLVDAVRVLLERGAKDVLVYATHAFLAGEAASKLDGCGLKRLIVTDTLPVPEEKQTPRMTIVTIADFLAQAILRVHEDKSLSRLIDDWDTPPTRSKRK